MKQITLILISIFLLLGIKLDAQILAKDPKAQKILDKVSKTTKSYNSIRIKFSYTIENLQEKASETHSGYAFLKGKRYKLIMAGTTIFSDGKTVWSYLKDAEEMTISEPGEDDQSIFNPAKLFTIYENGFKYKYLGEEKKNSSTLDVIDIFPEHPEKKSYSRIRLKIDRKKSQLVSIKSFGKSGNNVTINVTEFTTNVKMTDKLFVFDKTKYPADLEVVDTRD